MNNDFQKKKKEIIDFEEGGIISIIPPSSKNHQEFVLKPQKCKRILLYPSESRKILNYLPSGRYPVCS